MPRRGGTGGLTRSQRSAPTAARAALGRTKISPTDLEADPGAGGTLLTFVDGDGAALRWLLLDGTGIAARGGEEEVLAVSAGTRTALAVPGTEVTIHWLALAGELAPAQAAAAARLLLAEASAAPLADMHVAVGRPEEGLTPVALVPAEAMVRWVAGDPDLVVPEPLLLAPPAEGLVRRDHGAVPDYRGPAAAFSVEPELAGLLAGDAPIVTIEEAAFEAGLAHALAAPALNLRQGAFARRRSWTLDSARVRRIIRYAIVLAGLSLILQIATIMRYSFAADRLEAKTAALGTGPGPAARAGFGTVAAILFESVRATPNAELGRIDYRADGALAATLFVDSPATLAAFRQRAEASGLAIEGGGLTNAGGRPSTELVLRPS